MKINFKLYHLALACLAFLAISCDDHRMDDMVSDKVYFSKYGVNRQNVFKSNDFVNKIIVTKSGIGQQSGNVELIVDESILADYGNYQVIPSAYYTIKTPKVFLSESDYLSPVEVLFDAAKLEELIKSDSSGRTFALPVRLQSSDSKLEVSTEVDGLNKTVLVPTVLHPYLGFKTPGMQNNSLTISNVSAAETKQYLFVETNYDNLWDLSYKVTVDTQALTTYNEEHGTELKLLPAEGYRIDESTEIVPNNNNEWSLTYYLLKGKVPAGSYILPLSLTEVSKHEINPAAKTVFIRVNVQ